jgi:ABC-type sugar transport system permease subunit
MDQRFVLIYLPICLQSTFVGPCYFFSPCFINFAIVYPETKGVPLEEMDAVFGEGASLIILL